MESSNEYIGRRVVNYEIKSVIMSGAFGCVYMAQHQTLPRTAAIKILHSYHASSPDELDQFFLEAALLEQLRHPHILTIYDAGNIDDTVPYLITEFAHGGSLRDILLDLRSGKLSQEKALFILSQIGEGLEYIHRRGIIHRDLKPGNILFNKNDDALLADFGIAILMHSPRGERHASMVGTPSYMAPEQFQGRASAYSDQYALGCIAYELFTGHLPFTSSRAVSLKDLHLHHAPIPPTYRNPRIPSYIERAILTALEKDPRNRHANIPTFISALCVRPVYRQRQVQPVRFRVSQV
ncbi:MAG: serine/threonine-protein kinase [Ktedonobacteraceae bacterium]